MKVGVCFPSSLKARLSFAEALAFRKLLDWYLFLPRGQNFEGDEDWRGIRVAHFQMAHVFPEEIRCATAKLCGVQKATEGFCQLDLFFAWMFVLTGDAIE